MLFWRATATWEFFKLGLGGARGKKGLEGGNGVLVRIIYDVFEEFSRHGYVPMF